MMRDDANQVGPPDAADCGSVYAANAPFVHPETGEIWLYYVYGNELHGNPPRRGGSVHRGVGLAIIPKDRLVCIRPSASRLLGKNIL